MAKPMSDTLTEAQKAQLAAASAAVEQTRLGLSAATKHRHDLWRSLHAKGHSPSEIARASGVIRQAVSLAIRQ